MSVCPTNFDEKVECPFVDRKEFIEAYEKALPLYRRAPEIAEKKLGQSHPTTIEIKSNYSRLVSEMNEENEEK